MKAKFKRWAKRVLIGSAIALLSLLAYIFMVPFPRELLARERVTPVRVFDREGRLLREGLAKDGSRGRWVELSEISPWLVKATIVAEDRRFRSHGGVDWQAVLRAGKSNLSAGRCVSGASTLTMQLVRLLRPRHRSLWAKVDEAILAIRLERILTKDQILEEYLNRAPYGGNFVGAEAAALRTFGKSCHDLSPAEAALLAGLPQAPVRFDPRRHPDRARRRQRWILDEMHRLGVLDDQVFGRAVDEALVFRPGATVCQAQTFVDWVAKKGETEVHTTLDAALQRNVEGILRQADAHLSACGANEAAVVVLDNATGEILAFAGPAARRRSPGSTLKPLVYALELERGKTPASIYADQPVHYETPTGDYAPRNYDGTFHGPVTMRTALANSLNVPAVIALHEVGLARFLDLVHAIGFADIDPDPRKHGLGVVIGNSSASAVELAGAYAMLARGGAFRPAHGRGDPAVPRHLLSRATSYLIADILSDDDARALSFGTGTDLAFDFRVAAKTGTSPDHRDNWVAGFTARHTVVVWVGNRNGHPMRGTTGLDGAGPIFHAVMQQLGGAWIDRPGGIVEEAVCADTGLRPGEECRHVIREFFLDGHAPQFVCEPPPETFRIETPLRGDRFVVDAAAPPSTRFLQFRASAPEGATIEWHLDGKVLATTQNVHEVTWEASVGIHDLRARCDGREQIRRFSVK